MADPPEGHPAEPQRGRQQHCAGAHPRPRPQYERTRVSPRCHRRVRATGPACSHRAKTRFGGSQGTTGCASRLTSGSVQRPTGAAAAGSRSASARSQRCTRGRATAGGWEASREAGTWRGLHFVLDGAPDSHQDCAPHVPHHREHKEG